MTKIETKSLNQNEYHVYVHRPKEYKKFVKFAKKIWKDPNKWLYELHDEMKVPDNKKWHFWPKTVRYLNNIVYKREKAKKSLEISRNPATKEMAERHNEKVNKLNETICDSIEKDGQNLKRRLDEILNNILNVDYNKKNNNTDDNNSIEKENVIKNASKSIKIKEYGLNEFIGGIMKGIWKYYVISIKG